MFKAGLFLTALASVFSTAQAQDTLPTDLVLRFYSNTFGEELNRDDIFIGTLPPAIARLFALPPRSQAVGGLAQGTQGESAALDSELSPREVVAYYRGQLREQGYRQLPTPDQHSIFVDPIDLGSSFEGCHQGKVVSGSATRQDDETQIWLQTYTLSPSETCDSYYLGPPSEDSRPPLSLVPPLVSPEGSRSMGGGQSSGSRSGFTADQELETTLSIAEVLQHYAEQLTEADWQPVAVQGDNLTLRVFQTTAPSGMSYTIVLSARQEAEGYMSVFLGGG